MKNKKIFLIPKTYLNKLKQIILNPEMRILPGNLAFSIILSIAPIITLIALIASSFSISLLGIIDDFKTILPNDIFNMLDAFLKSDMPHAGSIFIYLLTGFIAASNGAHSIIITSNTLYGVKDDSYLKRRIKAFLLTIVIIFEFIFILIFLVYGNVIMRTILSLDIFNNIRDGVFAVFTLFKWPLLFIVTYILLKLLYALAPDTKVNSKAVTKGALFTTIGWLLITSLYAYYANNLANYGVFYGGLSNLIILMIWIYILSFILVIGIAINVSDYTEQNE